MNDSSAALWIALILFGGASNGSFAVPTKKVMPDIYNDDADQMKAWKVDSRVGNVRNNDEGLLNDLKV